MKGEKGQTFTRQNTPFFGEKKQSVPFSARLDRTLLSVLGYGTRNERTTCKKSGVREKVS